jgi:choline kinase
MQALILAAGRGSRLGCKGEDTPKCLLEIARRPLVELQLEMLAEAGVAPAGMVVGYCADEIRKVVGIRAEYIENRRWATTNSLYSFLLAKNWVRGDVVILNSDTLVHPAVLQRLLQTQGDCFAFDSTSGHAPEHMKVKLRDGCLVDMRKDLPPEESHGENVGILRLTADTTGALFEIAERLTSNGHENSWFGSGLREVVPIRRLRGVDVAGLPWGEIDSPYDLERARTEVFPAIARSQRRRAPVWRMARAAGILAVAAFLIFAVFRAFVVPQEVDWEVVDIGDLPGVSLRSSGHAQKWHLLRSGDQATWLRDWGDIQIESRLVFSDPEAQQPQPYVLEVVADGARLGWFLHSSAPSASWTHETFGIGEKNRLTFELDEHHRVLIVRLVASDSGMVLIRVRQAMPPEP